MPRENVPLGTLFSLNADEQCPFEAAIECRNCITDDDTIARRPGYRSALSGAIVGAGQAQGLWRFQYSPTGKKTLAAVAGHVYSITDPTTDLLSDGSSADLGALFGATANLSGAQLGTAFYVGTDENNVAMRRITSALAVETLEAIPQGSKPTASKSGALSFTLFKDLSAPTITGTAVFGTSGIPTGGTNWRSVTKTGADDDPLTGVTVLFKLAADFDARAYNWLAIGITPRDTNNTTGQVDILLGRDVATVATDLTVAQEVHDVPPIGGSPNFVYIPLDTLPVAVRSAVRYIKFVLSGSSGGKFAVHGYVFLPNRPLQSPENYYVTFQNSATLQESAPTEKLEVTVADADIVLPTYPDCYLDRGSFKSNGGSMDMLSSGNHRIFNREFGKAMPALQDIGVTITINGTSPAVTGPDLVRLWKDTKNGRRLDTTAAYPGSASAYSIPDIAGIAVLGNELYRPGGTPPRLNALASGQGRLIGGYENRVYVSSFTPPDQTSSRFPQFPAIGIIDADGSAFDIAPANTEQVQFISSGDDAGDATYILTNKCCRMMRELTPLARVFFVYKRGVVGRRAAKFADKTLFWASYDGVYASQNQYGAEEISQAVRRYYKDWLLPDSTTVVDYQDRCLYVTRGTRQLRYSFINQRWSRHTLAHTFLHSDSWYEVGGSEQLWYLTSDRKIARWQAAATSDMMVNGTAGTAIPSWEYSTGYTLAGVKTRPNWVYCDRSGTVKVYFHDDGADEAVLEKAFGGPGEEELSIGPREAHKWRIRITGASGSIMRRLMWEREVTSGRGGPKK